MPPSRFTHKQTLSNPPSYFISTLFIVFQLVIIGLLWMQLPPQIPLYYSLPYGFSRLINKGFIFLIPGLSFCLWLVGLGLQKVNLSSPIYRHIQFWIIQLILFLNTIALVHSVLIVL